MKKLITFLVAISMTAGLSACQNIQENQDNTTEIISQDTEPSQEPVIQDEGQWQKITNEELGLQIFYPSMMSSRSNTSNPIITLNKKITEDIYPANGDMNIAVRSYESEQSLEEWYAGNGQWSTADMERRREAIEICCEQSLQASQFEVEERTRLIAGEEALLYRGNVPVVEEGNPYSLSVFTFKKGNNIVEIQASTPIGDLTEENLLLFEEIIQKMRLIPQGEELVLSGKSITLHENWALLSSEDNMATAQIPDPEHEVSIDIQLLSSDEEASEDFLIGQTDLGAPIYQSPCAPALQCYLIIQDDQTFFLSFSNLQSSQEAPENLDGPWFPSTTIVDADLLSIAKTFR